MEKYPLYKNLNYFEKFIFKTCFFINNPSWKIFNIYFLKNKIFINRDYLKESSQSEKKQSGLDLDSLKERYKTAFGNDFLDILIGKKILDLGCGRGDYALMLAKFSNCTVHGIDLIHNFEMVNKYREKYKIDNLTLSVSDISQVNDQSYDLVISHDSFEHFEKPEFMFSEMVRVLKPGGSLWIQFGPSWYGPYGRHMSGTFRKDRPWLHLILPEKTIMRCHSVLKNRGRMVEKFKEKKGGLNKMGFYRFTKIVKKFGFSVNSIQTLPISKKLRFLIYIPIIKELFIASISAKLNK